MKDLLLLLLVTIGVVSGLELNKIDDNAYLVARDDTEEPDWWQNAVFYQIYPRSFKDSDNDGIGDLKGISEKLSYLYSTGVTAVWLSPIFKSPQVDQGYDISDYYDVDPDYGTLDDLRQLVDRAHGLNIKIILDFVPNHTSDQHDWFVQSVNNATGPYGDFYVWRDCEKLENGTVIPPNNWLSHFKGSAWEYNEIRNQCYLHQFAVAQPDLNYTNPVVVASMKDVLTYWLEFGVDGFRCDAVSTLFEDPEFRDEPLSNITGVDENDHSYLNHIYTLDQPETFDMIYQWREHLDDFTEKNQTHTRVMMTEAYTSIDKTMLYYGSEDGSRKGAHFAFNFVLITNLTKGFGIEDLEKSINGWLSNIPSTYTSNWVLGNHDNHRVATRFGTEYIDALNMLTSFLPGVMVTYNGEEIGMENGEVTCEEGHDPQAIKNCSTFDEVSRDFERTPFQWDNSTNAGFNEGAKPWLPVSNKSAEVNLAAQDVRGLVSHYNVYKELLELKQSLGSSPNLTEVSIVKLSDNVVQLIRKNNNLHYNLVLNLGGENETVEYEHWFGPYMVMGTSVGGNYKSGDEVDGTLDLAPYESIIMHNTMASGGPSGVNILSSLLLLCIGIIASIF